MAGPTPNLPASRPGSGVTGSIDRMRASPTGVRLAPILRSDVLFALGIITIILFMLIPMPTIMMDAGLSVSITFSVLILMTVLFIQTPLEFSTFPTVLLISTALRLGLNVASTRLILENGHEGLDAAGGIIEAFGTFIINFSASFVIGLFLVWSTERVLLDPRWRTFVAIGFCGSYSTYSSYAFETLALFEKGHWTAAAANVLFMNVLCFVAVVMGAALARSVR